MRSRKRTSRRCCHSIGDHPDLGWNCGPSRKRVRRNRVTIRSDSYWLTVPITPSIETVGDEKLNTVIPTWVPELKIGQQGLVKFDIFLFQLCLDRWARTPQKKPITNLPMSRLCLLAWWVQNYKVMLIATFRKLDLRFTSLARSSVAGWLFPFPRSTAPSLRPSPWQITLKRRHTSWVGVGPSSWCQSVSGCTGLHLALSCNQKIMSKSLLGDSKLFTLKVIPEDRAIVDWAIDLHVQGELTIERRVAWSHRRCLIRPKRRKLSSFSRSRLSRGARDVRYIGGEKDSTRGKYAIRSNGWWYQWGASSMAGSTQVTVDNRMNQRISQLSRRPARRQKR